MNRETSDDTHVALRDLSKSEHRQQDQERPISETPLAAPELAYLLTLAISLELIRLKSAADNQSR